MRKCHEYLTRATAQEFIPFMRLLQDSFVSSSFFSSPDIFFLNFVFHFHLFDGVSHQDTQVFVDFIFSKRF